MRKIGNEHATPALRSGRRHWCWLSGGLRRTPLRHRAGVPRACPTASLTFRVCGKAVRAPRTADTVSKKAAAIRSTTGCSSGRQATSACGSRSSLILRTAKFLSSPGLPRSRESISSTSRRRPSCSTSSPKTAVHCRACHGAIFEGRSRSCRRRARSSCCSNGSTRSGSFLSMDVRIARKARPFGRATREGVGKGTRLSSRRRISAPIPVGFNKQPWIDSHGTFYTDALRVVERWKFADANTIDYEATIEDPKVFTQPWKIAYKIVRLRDRDFELIEEACWEGVSISQQARGRPHRRESREYRRYTVTASPEDRHAESRCRINHWHRLFGDARNRRCRAGDAAHFRREARHVGYLARGEQRRMEHPAPFRRARGTSGPWRRRWERDSLPPRSRRQAARELRESHEARSRGQVLAARCSPCDVHGLSLSDCPDPDTGVDPVPSTRTRCATFT